jgi:hypothetical protein
MYRIADMIGPQFVQRRLLDGRFVRAVPIPYPTKIRERLKPAFLVLIGKAYATQWPEDGDLEKALQYGTNKGE